MSQPELESTACMLCGANDYQVAHANLRDWAYGLPGEFQLVSCQQCGHIYQNPRPTQTSIGDYYPTHYQPFWMAAPQQPLLRWLQKMRWQPRCQQVLKVKKSGRILDVGASTGIFLYMLQQYGGWQADGVEISAEAVAFAKQHYNIDLFAGQLDEAPWPAATFDVITLWDVLEHLPNPHAALEKIHALLKPDGVLLMGMPNADSVDARLFGRYWIGLDPPRHFSVFSRAGLTRLLQHTGFKVERLYSYYGRYTTFALSTQQWLHAHLPPGLLRNVITRLLFLPLWRYLTAPYFILLDVLGRGSQMTVLARPVR